MLSPLLSPDEVSGTEAVSSLRLLFTPVCSFLEHVLFPEAFLAGTEAILLQFTLKYIYVYIYCYGDH